MMTPWLLLAGLPIGAVVGSYASTAALRAGRGEQAVVGRSRCDSCDRTLGFRQTLPILSFVARRGVCGACSAPIPSIHLVGEVAGLAVAGMAFAAAPPLRAMLLGALGLLLLAAALIDAKTLKLPDVLIVMIGVACAILSASRSMAQLVQGVIVAVLAFALLQGVRWVFRARRGHDGLGFGDVLLIAALGLWLGAATAWAVALAGAIGLLGIAIARPRGRQVAFGPSIALGAWTVGLLLEAGIWPVV